MRASIHASPDSSPIMPSTSPVSIGWPASSSPSSASASSSFSSTSSKNSSASVNWTSSSTYISSMSCAFPSWPSRHSLSPPLLAQDPSAAAASKSSRSSSCATYSYHDLPSAYISDFDLCPEDLQDDELPYLDEAPAPPREYKMPVTMPLVPLYPSQRPYGEKKRKSSSRSKSRPMGKPMSPILEAPINS